MRDETGKVQDGMLKVRDENRKVPDENEFMRDGPKNVPDEKGEAKKLLAELPQNKKPAHYASTLSQVSLRNSSRPETARSSAYSSGLFL